MGDLQHIDPGQIGALGQQGLLRVRFEVTRQEHAQPSRADEQGDARIVGPRPALLRPTAPAGTPCPAHVSGRADARGAVPPDGAGRWQGPYDLPAQIPVPAPLPGVRGGHRYPGLPRRPAHERGLVRRLRQPRRPDLPHSPPPQHTWQPRHMVGVEMGEHHQRHRPHTQPAQAPVHGAGLRAGVHHHGTAPAAAPRVRREHQGVPLPHVAGHHPPSHRRPSRERPHQRRRPHQRHQQCERAHGTQPRPARQPQPDHDQPQHDRHHRKPQRPRPRTGPAHLRTGQ